MSDIGVFLLLFACLLIAVGLIRFFSWLTELQEKHGSLGRAGVNTVKRYIAVERPVMAREDETQPVYLPSALQTDNRQTTDKPAPAVPSRDVMLNSHKLLRKYGIPREEARLMYKSLGLPLDNNLWADAAPPEDEHRTPIVGRPTSARFETDADYPYQPIKS